MNALISLEEKISLNIIYESQKVETLECNINEKMEKILISFAKKNNVEYSLLSIIYNGALLQKDSLKKSFFEVMNAFDTKEKSMSILIYRATTTTTNINNIKREPEKINTQNMINIILIIDSKNPLVLQGKREEKIIDIINKNSLKIGLGIDTLTFKYGVNEIDLNKKFDDLASERDKNLSGITLSVYTKIPIKVIFINKIDNNNNNNNDDDRKKIVESFLEDNIKDVCLEYCSLINKNIKDLSFKYKGIEIETNKTFVEMLNYILNIINSSNIVINETTDNLELKPVPKNIKEIEITVNLKPCLKRHKILLIVISSIVVISIAALIIILLIKHHSPPNPKPSDIIETTDIITTTIKLTDIISTIKLTNKASDKITKICEPGYFIPLDDLSLEDCQKCSIEGCKVCNGTYEKNECSSCGNLVNIYDKNNKIIECNMTCETGEEEKCLTCDKDNNICSSCNIGYKLVNGKCRPDFFIKAIFNTIQVGDKVDLYYPSNAFLESMIVEGKKMSPTKSYIFEEIGNHTVYYKFSKIRFDVSSISGFFYYNINSKNDYLISVTFSDFDEYIPEVSFKQMFFRRKKLYSVDFSKISLNLNFDLTQIFYECENLTYVNFNKKKSFFKITDLEYMFYNCKSLTSINLSKLNVSSVKSFKSMFNGCTSLKSLNINNFKLTSATSISFMFNNCFSLDYLNLSYVNSSNLDTMNYAFSNCRSLTSIYLNGFRTSTVKYMDHLFYNCIALKLVNLSTFNTIAVKNMDSMFENCISLTSIIFGNTFITTNNPTMLVLFNNCHSLKIMDYPLYVHGIKNLTAFFANCYSLTSVNLKNFNTSQVSNFNYMFYNCYNLTSIDISSFNFRHSAYTYYMFSGCFSLTSMDFSNFTKTMLFYSGMFYNCPNLSYLDFTIYNAQSTSLIFNSNISANGTLILDTNFNEYLVQRKINFKPKNWKLITK